MSTKTTALMASFVSMVMMISASCAGYEALRAPEDGHRLAVLIHQETEEAGPVRVQLVNEGTRPIAVCPCLGPPSRFVVFDIEPPTRTVAYPEVLFGGREATRFSRCLRPGEAVEVRVDLREWRPLWAGSVDVEFASVDLLTNRGAYRLRARYINDKGSSATSSCPPFRGRSISNWLLLRPATERVQQPEEEPT
jgi:hypothetical protein